MFPGYAAQTAVGTQAPPRDLFESESFRARVGRSTPREPGGPDTVVVRRHVTCRPTLLNTADDGTDWLPTASSATPGTLEIPSWWRQDHAGCPSRFRHR